ncbi:MULTISPECIES: gamma-glutamylcyclotransferase [unclassified Rhizobium]|uniref:gamma-glutamylcyclotransferase n=1 Tax=unclassified Rhizobium TaxID=2613769 RepID=UPI001A98B275|nr:MULTISPECIES: gamma-glutamylcyclotransferase [unclassified Rhizobium]MBX5161844.1 gamma-glutamylcyclotransferase [Rhizobium sp. NZLR8]MBX5163790.1 gamma-glutamylcyclotransferase [Rhizobium sp. NZLR4b]MBX5169555.1 gamma-glutamylcyclotransferase [Rhizobium sp. NZLR1b]MBX5183128.1 gamma-glutamylcyclotransferase [Rhizobium sp. NZLR5]MBX5190073.1 gamma-glutamylcyclotransferase [Rhizobium sp. NZLR3b]
MDEIWVFGYGSLMWNPGFEFMERAEALIYGYRRSLCVRSFVHRGTRDSPGLVLGLDRGGACRGMAFRISPEKWDEVIDYLRARELVTNVYLERRVRLQLAGGCRVEAVTYIADRDHEQYAGTLDAFEAARVVSQAKGQSGPNDAYVFNTAMHLKQMGIRDHWLEQVVDEVERLRAA